MDTIRLPQEFYNRDARVAARGLLGQRLVRQLNGRRLSGIIVETEAYCATGAADLACHGSKNQGRPTPRTAVMFGPAGWSYVYFTYGMHWLFNIVTGPPAQPSAVLIRALEPLEGEDLLARNRGGRPRRDWTSGPAKLAQALQIDENLNRQNLCSPESVIWCETEPAVPPERIKSGPRIGLGQTPEPWKSIPWRFWIEGNPFVSRAPAVRGSQTTFAPGP